MGGQLDGGTKILKVKFNKGKRCIRDFNIMETKNYGLSTESCVKK